MIRRLSRRLINNVLRPIREQKELYRWASTIESSKSGIKRIVSEYKLLYDKKGLTTDEYYDFEFEKQSEEFKQEFLGLNEQRVYMDYLNPIKYYSLARNKFLAHIVLEDTGIRKSTLYCYYQPEARYFGCKNYANDLLGVISILKSKEVCSCVIKTTESSHGDNVWVIKDIQYENNDAVLTRFDNKIFRLSSILGQDPLVFEGVVRQTKQFSSFNESSVNTVRFMTTLWPDGSARVVSTWFKVGRAGRCVDNAGSGGNIDAAIDVETGRIYNVIQFDGWRDTKEIERHPDNDQQLNGVVIENWQAIRSDVEKFQQAFPFCKAIGWDIAITDAGPVVIEINDFWDRTGQFFLRRGWRKDIRECYLAWKKTGKSYIIGRDRNQLPKTMLNTIIESE